MLKETEYQEKFELIVPWMAQIIEVVKKDLKNEYFKIFVGIFLEKEA